MVAACCMGIGKNMSLTEKLHISGDVLEGDAIVTMIGSGQVHVENIKSIMEYEESLVRLRLKKGVLDIEGCGLVVDYYDDSSIHVRGRVSCARIVG